MVPRDGVTILVVTAMADEMAPFLAAASEVGGERAAGGGIRRDAVIADVPVVLLVSGVGMVNGAVATTAVLTTDAVSAVISAGTAGGVGHGLVVGDVVLGAECIPADADARAFGYELGQVPRMPARYRADAELVAIVEDLHAQERIPATYFGLVLSSDTFVTPARAETMRIDFPEVSCVDMESAAIAQACFRHDVPFATVRGISDGADHDAASNWAANAELAGARSAEVVVELLREYQARDGQ